MAVDPANSRTNIITNHFIFNIANVLLIAGIEIVGLAVAFPLSIGIALVEGVVLSYALQPRGNPLLLAAGVAMALLAVILAWVPFRAANATASWQMLKGLAGLNGVALPRITTALDFSPRRNATSRA